MEKFIVIETPCWPAKWKIIQSNCRVEDNTLSNFFRSKQDAQKEAHRRNQIKCLI